MTQGAIEITVTGNLTADPELSCTPNGVSLCKFTVAAGTRKYDKDKEKWVDAGTSFVRCTAWRYMAENIAETLSKGNRVVVTGTFASRDYTDKEEVKRTAWELTVSDIGPSLLYATAKIKKTERKEAESSE